jgi:hypothetical protein
MILSNKNSMLYTHVYSMLITLVFIFFYFDSLLFTLFSRRIKIQINIVLYSIWQIFHIIIIFIRKTVYFKKYLIIESLSKLFHTYIYSQDDLQQKQNVKQIFSLCSWLVELFSTSLFLYFKDISSLLCKYLIQGRKKTSTSSMLLNSNRLSFFFSINF